MKIVFLIALGLLFPSLWLSCEDRKVLESPPEDTTHAVVQEGGNDSEYPLDLDSVVHALDSIVGPIDYYSFGYDPCREYWPGGRNDYPSWTYRSDGTGVYSSLTDSAFAFDTVSTGAWFRANRRLVTETIGNIRGLLEIYQDSAFHTNILDGNGPGGYYLCLESICAWGSLSTQMGMVAPAELYQHNRVLDSLVKHLQSLVILQQ